MASNHGSINPRLSQFYADIIDQKPGFKIVGSVQNEMDVFDKAFDIRKINIRYDRLNLNLGIDFLNLSFGGDRFRKILFDVLFVKENLALEIIEFNEIAIDDSDESHAGTCERIHQNGSERTTTNNRDAA